MPLFQRWGWSRFTATGVNSSDRGEQSRPSKRGWGGNHKWRPGTVVGILGTWRREVEPAGVPGCGKRLDRSTRLTARRVMMSI